MTTVDDPMPLDDALRIIRNVSEHNTRDTLSSEIERLRAALEEIARLPYFYEETAWTWSDISKKQTDIARAALGLMSVKKDLER